jgi:large subunit ribosomal protein L22
MPGPKTNEVEGTRAVLRYARVSPYKVRAVVDVIRGKPVGEATDLLRFLERDAAIMVEKVLRSAVANASNNDHLDPEELYVSACYVDEGPTAKRWRPRARGRATRIRKRSSHITVIVSRLPEDRLARLQARWRAENLAMRARRVEATRRARAGAAEGASRRERRHPEAAVPVEEPAGVEETEPVTDLIGAGTTSAEEALLNEVDEEEAEAEAQELEPAEGAEAAELELEPAEAEAELEPGPATTGPVTTQPQGAPETQVSETEVSETEVSETEVTAKAPSATPLVAPGAEGTATGEEEEDS